MEAVMDYGPDALLLAAVLAGVTLLLVVVRYVRADRGTRASMRQAVRVRWGWMRLARMAGLTVTDKTPGLLAQIAAQKDGATPAPRVLTPKIKVKPDQFGVIVRARTLPQVGLEEYQKSARFLADAWRCTRVSVLPDGPGKVVIRGVRSDPLTTPTTHRPTGRPLTDLTRWELGVDEYAAKVWVSLANVPGVTVAGVPGAGKTSGVNKFVCDFAPSAAVQIATADGKVSRASEGDYADLVKRMFAFCGDDLDEANALFKRLVDLRKRRSATIREVLGVKNMWHVGPSPEWPLTVLIIDEAHTYFREYKGSDAATKRLAALTAENARLVEDLVKKGRSVGILVILISQKTTGDAIPTFIRDVCPIGLSFAQKTVEAAVAALGEDIRNWPDASPVTLQDPAYVGVAVMAMQGRPGYTRIRTPYVSDTDAARVAEATSHLTADPDLCLDTLLRSTGRTATPALSLTKRSRKAHVRKEVENMAEERFTRRTVTVVMAVIAALAFVFSFGNVWALALRLGVPRPIAPLIAPMVDLSVVGLLVALRFLTLRGVSKAELRAGTRLLHLCGLLTLALNTAEPLLTGRYGRACLDTVAPLLLLGWGHVGPALLAQFHTPAAPTPHLEDATTPSSVPVPDEALAPEPAPPAPVPVTVASPTEEPPTAPAPAAVTQTARPASGPALPAALLDAARRIADTHRAEHGTPITAAHLGARMGIALPVATAALAQI